MALVQTMLSSFFAKNAAEDEVDHLRGEGQTTHLGNPSFVTILPRSCDPAAYFRQVHGTGSRLAASG